MSTVTEIESAIERLPSEQVREIAAWVEQYQTTIDASAAVFSQLDAEEGEGEQWREPKEFGATSSLVPRLHGCEN